MSNKEYRHDITSRLEEFHVEVPDIPMKKSILGRLANWIYAPAKNPLEIFHVKADSVTRLVLFPFILVFVLSLAPLFLI